MSLPKAVQAQVDEVNRIQATLGPQEASSPESDPPAEIETSDAESSALAPSSQAESQFEPQDQDWEHKYRSEVGRFKAETERAREAAQMAWQQVEQLRQEMASMRAEMTKAPEPESEPETEPETGITPADIDTFGSELVEFAQRAARKAAMDSQRVLDIRLKAMDSALAEIRGQVGQVETKTQQTAEQRFYKDLEAEIPNWSEINNDPAFHAWLQQPEGLSGYPRQAFLNQAHQALDVGRVAAFFNFYRADQGQPAVSAPSKAPSKAQSELRKQVSPPRSKASASAPSKGDQKIWTQDEIMHFYEAKARGKIDPTEAARMESDLNSAVAEGRVQL